MLAAAFDLFAKIFHYHVYSMVFVFGLLALFYTNRRVAMVLAMMLALLLAPAVKEVYSSERVCEQVPGLVECPDDPGMPSAHAFAFTIIAVATIESAVFPIFLALDGAVVYSRLYLGVHTLPEVGAGMALGIIVFTLCSYFCRHFGLGCKKYPRVEGPADEKARKEFHVAFGLLLATIVFLFGASSGIALLMASLFLGSLLIYLHFQGKRVPVVSELIDSLERNTNFAGRGALFFVVGALALLSFSRTESFALAVLLVMTVSDGLSSFAQKEGGAKIPWNKHKSCEAFLAFLGSSSIIMCFFVGWIGLVYALLISIVESLDLWVGSSRPDDNLTVPLAALLLNLALFYLGIDFLR